MEMTSNSETAVATALVADDDETARRRLVRALAAVWPGLRIVQAVNGVEAWDAFLEHEPALCFLDVRMPGLTGIEVAQRIGDRAQTVFVMAANDRALTSFEDDAVDHLIKPLEPAAGRTRYGTGVAAPAGPARRPATAAGAAGGG